MEPTDPTQPGPPSTTPPTEFDEIPEKPSRWPKVIGIISLIYAICGLLCVTVGGVMMAIINQLPEMFRGGVTLPPIIRLTGAVQSVLGLCLGILMLSGAVSLLRRRHSGVGLLKNWAVLRIILVLLAVGAAVLTGPAQIQMARQGLEFKNKMLEENNRPELVEQKSDDQLRQSVILQTGISSALFVIYPIFLGLFLSRKKIKAEVADWAEEFHEAI